MILYFAGSEPKSSRQILSSVGVKNVLISFFHFRDRTGERIKELLSTFDRVFLDSGGFSARIKGVPIEVEDYKNY